nr:DUF4260 domain-containing protein [Salibacterium halotolerans]
MNKMLLHVEGAVVLGISLYLYSLHGNSWVLFALLLLSPDLAMLGYAAGNKAGAVIYNVFHTYSLPLVLIAAGMLLAQPLLPALGLIWTAHIGMDRAVGYGLKYPAGFKKSHLNKV